MVTASSLYACLMTDCIPAAISTYFYFIFNTFVDMLQLDTFYPKHKAGDEANDSPEDGEATQGLQATRGDEESNDARATYDEPEAPGKRKLKRKLVSVRLNIMGQAKCVILKSEETDCHVRAMTEPVMKILSNLPIPEFYFQLTEWKVIITAGLEKVSASRSAAKATMDEANSGAHGGDDERASRCGNDDDSDTEMIDVSTTVDPDAIMNTVSVLRELEYDTHKR